MDITSVLPQNHVRTRKNGNANKIGIEDRSFHDWYRFVLSFPPHLVQDYIKDFEIDSKKVLLDPFCGTGTTLVECKLNNIHSQGIEANPFAFFATTVKTDWDIDPVQFLSRSKIIAREVKEILIDQGIDDDQLFKGNIQSLNLIELPSEENKLLISGSISPLPLHKILTLLHHLSEYQNDRCYAHYILALANTLVSTASNLNFGPEVGVGKRKEDAPVISSWLANIERMAKDIVYHPVHFGRTKTFFADSRDLDKVLSPESIDAIITSPPYPNEKDYTRITRLESVILGFIKDRNDLRTFKKGLIRSNTRNVYTGDDDDKWVEKFPEIQRLGRSIENRRQELSKTSGFEKQYAKVTKLYFGGMYRHLDSLRPILRPNARLAYVVGDQASYFRIMIHTGKILADIANDLGYEIVRTDLFRTRLATATKEQLREEVLILRWKG